MSRRLAIVAALAALLPWAGGCQVIWASITSPSDSVSGSSTAIAGSVEAISVSSGSGSSSDSSGGDQRESAFREDVSGVARVAAREGLAGEAFLRELGRVAERHGVSHWEGDSTALHAIGAGFRQAGLAEPEVEPLLRRVGLEAQREQVIEGYRSTRL